MHISLNKRVLPTLFSLLLPLSALPVDTAAIEQKRAEYLEKKVLFNGSGTNEWVWHHDQSAVKLSLIHI